MGKPLTLLEDLCRHASALGAPSIVVEYRNSRQWVAINEGGTSIGIANYASSSTDGKELQANLAAAAKKPLRTVIDGQVCLLKVRSFKNLEEDVFEVSVDHVPKPDPSVAPSFTAKQGQYLAFIHSYRKIHRQAQAELDLQRYFQVSPPSVHEMVKTLERNCLIERTAGQARSIRLLVRPEHLPPLV